MTQPPFSASDTPGEATVPGGAPSGTEAESPAAAFPPDWETPAFEAEVYRPRSTRYACVIPVINEGAHITRQLAEMREQGHLELCDTIIADGGSTDGSVDTEALRALGLRAKLVKTGPGKLSAQLRMAYAWALAEGYEGIVTIDGNGKDGVEAIPSFVEALDRGVGYAQASRFVAGGVAENTPVSRTLAIRLLHAPISSLAARKWLTDTTQGFRAYSRDFLLDPRVKPFRDIFQTYELLAYLSVRASRLGYRVEELPTRRSYPRGEPIPTKISFFGGNAQILKILLAAARGAYAPED